MTERVNFLMTPNIAFDLLTKDSDLVGYQKLIRLVGIGGCWKSGNKALAKELNISYSRCVELKGTLQKNKLIRINPGDAALSQPDEIIVLDVFEYREKDPYLNYEHPPIHNLNTPYLNYEQGGNEPDAPENTEVVENKDESPYSRNEHPPIHNLNTPYLKNEQGPYLNFIQHLNKIFSKEEKDLKKISLSARARENPPDQRSDEEQFILTIVDGLKLRLGTPNQLSNAEGWKNVIDFAFQNSFEPDQVLLTWDLLKNLRSLKKKRWRITPEMVENNLPNPDELQLEIRELRNKSPINGNNQLKLEIIPEEETFDVDYVIGRSIETAEKYFAENGYILRIMKNNGEPLALDNDFRDDRINVSVRDGEIIEIMRIG